MQDDTPLSAFDSHILRDAFKASVAELRLPETSWVEHATAMLRDVTDTVPLESGIVEWIITQVKAPLGAMRANDNGTTEDHLVLVTLGLHRTLSGLEAPAEVLAAVLPGGVPGTMTRGRRASDVP